MDKSVINRLLKEAVEFLTRVSLRLGTISIECFTFFLKVDKT